jgi:hypothetical protein
LPFRLFAPSGGEAARREDPRRDARVTGGWPAVSRGWPASLGRWCRAIRGFLIPRPRSRPCHHGNDGQRSHAEEGSYRARILPAFLHWADFGSCWLLVPESSRLRSSSGQSQIDSSRLVDAVDQPDAAVHAASRALRKQPRLRRMNHRPNPIGVPVRQRRRALRVSSGRLAVSMVTLGAYHTAFSEVERTGGVRAEGALQVVRGWRK